MKTINKILTFGAVMLTVLCCTGLKEIREDIADLKSRIRALEIQMDALNQNIKALKVLAECTTLNKVEAKDGKYYITTSNGIEIVLTQGSMGYGRAPIMSIDSDGFWMVDYQDGNGPVYIYRGGEKVYALGIDGLTPTFGVDEQGYWTVSYDNGVTCINVLDPNGNKVKAVADESMSDSYFEDVRYDESTNTFVLTLKNGISYEIPVISDFYCAIVADDANLVEFALGETKIFTVLMKGVADAFLTIPDNWVASLSDNQLTVTAPTVPPTKATIADSRTDVSILAISNHGFSTITRLRVQLAGVDYQTTPLASVQNVAPTATSISFDVKLEDATSWYWMVALSSESEPQAEKIISEGIPGTEKTVTAEGLLGNSDYSIYVLPLNSTTPGEVAKADIRTSKHSDLYQAYMDGYPISIAGKVISRAVDGDARYVVATEPGQDLASEVKGGGILFLDSEDGAYFSVDKAIYAGRDLILVNSPSSFKVKVEFLQNGNIRPGTGLAVLGLNIDFVKRAHWLVSYNGDNNMSFMYFDDCDLQMPQSKPVFYSSTAHYIESIRFVRNRIYNTTKADETEQFINFGATTALRGMKEVVFNNNVCYSSAPINFSYISFSGAAQTVGTVGGEKVEMKYNMFYNCIGSYCYLNLWHADTIEIDKNVLCVPDPESTNLTTARTFRFFCTESAVDTQLILGKNVNYGASCCYAHHESVYAPEVGNWWKKQEENPVNLSASIPIEGYFVMCPGFEDCGPRY